MNCTVDEHSQTVRVSRDRVVYSCTVYSVTVHGTTYLAGVPREPAYLEPPLSTWYGDSVLYISTICHSVVW